MTRRRRKVDWAQEIADGLNTFNSVTATARNANMNKELADTQAAPSETQVASGEDALKAADTAKQAALANAATPEDAAKIEQAFKPTMDALQADAARPSSVAYSLGTGGAFKQQDKPFSQSQIDTAEARRQAQVFLKYGRPNDAAKVMSNLEASRNLADNEELRAVLSEDPVNVRVGSLAKKDQMKINPMDHYMKEVVPKSIQTLIKQGRIEDAKRYSDFLESQQGQTYAKQYTNGLRLWAVGDHEGAMRSFEQLYNDDLYPDGRKAKFSIINGDEMRIDQIDDQGKVVGSKTGKVSDLTEQVALALNPLQAVKYMAEQQAKRKSEDALLDRQIELETLRQQGQDKRDDRRDARTSMQIEGAARRAEIAARNRGDGSGLTVPQQRTNDSILAARRSLQGMTQAEVLRRTQSTTATGRENPDYDPQLASNVRLAQSRLYGDDPEHDKFISSRAGHQSPAASLTTPAKQTPLQAAQAAMASDSSMSGLRLGENTSKGFKVYDAKGKHIGYYGKQ